MPGNYLMPTRLVHGPGSLDDIPSLVETLGISRPFLITDPVIGAQPYVAAMRAALDDAGRPAALFDDCAVDARAHQVDAQTARAVADRHDGIICVGGGSVICAGKAVAIAAANGGRPIRDFAGVTRFESRPLPMIVVPTTAGSGAEVSQFLLVKDEARHDKLVIGGPQAFPDIAVLDPVVLEAMPQGIAAITFADALTHTIDSVLTSTASALTDGLALEALRLLALRGRESILDRAPDAMADQLLASSMANMACGNSRLGLAHCLGLPLEAKLDMVHGIAVGVLLPRVLAFNAPAAPGKVMRIAGAFGLIGDDPGKLAAATSDAIFALYDDIGFAPKFDPALFDPARCAEMALEAGKGLYGEGYVADPPNDATPIPTPNIRPARIADACAIYEGCFG